MDSVTNVVITDAIKFVQQKKKELLFGLSLCNNNFTPLGHLFELKLLSFPYFAAISLIVLSCVFAAEVAKKIFYNRVKF